jgi:hypothetical protein
VCQTHGLTAAAVLRQGLVWALEQDPARLDKGARHAVKPPARKKKKPPTLRRLVLDILQAAGEEPLSSGAIYLRLPTRQLKWRKEPVASQFQVGVCLRQLYALGQVARVDRDLYTLPSSTLPRPGG